ncbi:MAG: GPW/gp25 family protein [Opitutaceae bacterium]
MILNPKIPRAPIGWPLLPTPDAEGRLAFPSLADSVRQNLEVILSTRSGEQLMHPAYGAGLVDFIGEADTITTRRRIHDRVTDSMGRWEPRIEIDLVDVTDVAGKPGHVRVHIGYRLRRTGEARTFGVNLQLES